MYVEDNAAPMVKNFCIVYIEMAFDRIHLEVCLAFSGIWNLILKHLFIFLNLE